MRSVKLALAVLAALAPLASAAEPGSLRWSPAANTFACDLPGPDWTPFEEEEADGPVAHILGPDNPASNYRAGIDVRFYEKGQPHWVAVKQTIDRLRREDDAISRRATPPRPLRLSGVLARIFEVTEKRWLPEDSAPASVDELHHYYAVVPAGENYFVLRLSSTRDVYLDYRQPFVQFLRTFRPLGYR